MGQKVKTFILLLLLTFMVGISCKPGDEDPEEGSLIGQLLYVSSLNGTVWTGKPVWNSCQYYPGSISGIANCQLLENAYSGIYADPADMMTVTLMLNGAAVTGSINITDVNFDLLPFNCTFNVTGNTNYNPQTGITLVTLESALPCTASSGNTVRMTYFRTEMLRESQRGKIILETVHASTSDRAVIEFVFELIRR